MGFISSRKTGSRGFTPWYNLFGQLRALRAWGPIDRIPDETIDYWEAKLERAEADLLIRTEVELWSFATTHRQREASEQFEATVAEAGGTIIDRASIREIGYEGAPIDLPAER